MARDRIDPYTALIIQPEVTVCEDRAGIQQNLDRVKNLIHFGVGYFWEVPVRTGGIAGVLPAGCRHTRQG